MTLSPNTVPKGVRALTHEWLRGGTQFIQSVTGNYELSCHASSRTSLHMVMFSHLLDRDLGVEPGNTVTECVTLPETVKLFSKVTVSL